MLPFVCVKMVPIPQKGVTGVILSAQNISINYGMRQILNDISFYLNDHDKVGVVGINGTGKSTLLRIIAGA